jgi:hypothetical protein
MAHGLEYPQCEVDTPEPDHPRKSIPARSLKKIIIYVYFLPASLYSNTVSGRSGQRLAGGAAQLIKNLQKEICIGETELQFSKAPEGTCKEKKERGKKTAKA